MREPTVPPQAWIVRDLRPRTEIAPPDAASERKFSRAVFGPVEEAEFRAVFEQLVPASPSSLRWLMRNVHEGGAPYALLDCEGPLDEVLVTELARRLDVFFTAIDLAGPLGAFRWSAGGVSLVRWGRFAGLTAAAPPSNVESAKVRTNWRHCGAVSASAWG